MIIMRVFLIFFTIFVALDITFNLHACSATSIYNTKPKANGSIHGKYRAAVYEHRPVMDAMLPEGFTEQTIQSGLDIYEEVVRQAAQQVICFF